ncbi:MAG: alpha/beta hydrolase-fold protein [Acidobacteria bacterium]|nr:alpha/beta hydrolase-fold protein [Acidobacteriota bacterium]
MRKGKRGNGMMMRTGWICLMMASAVLAEKVSNEQLISLAQKRAPELDAALRDTLGAEAIAKGTAVAGWGVEYIWAVESATDPLLAINLTTPFRVNKLAGNLWVYQGQLRAGTSHKFHWIINGRPFGGKNDLAAFGPESYPQPGVVRGKMHGPIEHASKIYPGLKTNYWFYVPAQLDAATAAPVMVWQDGEKYSDHEKPARLVHVLDNLTAQKRIPAMVTVLISPGKIGDRPMRSVQYDTVNDDYARYLLDEILPEVEKTQKLRKDGYSRAIGGESSGAVCAFTAAWFKPTEFARVLSRIGTYTSIQWKPKIEPNRSSSDLDGGNIYPFAIRKQPKRNIRVWLSDGAEDLENNHGSWPLQNIQMANSLKMTGYDYAFRFSLGTHSTAHGNAELPEALTWLWRDYDPAKTSQEFKADPTEKDKPYWRVQKLNREQ